jgi:TRAP-type C4-dicarboxylate transport system permease small subunit
MMEGFMRRFLEGISAVNRWMQNVASVALTFMMCLTTADVILRGFGRPIAGTYEIVAICGGIIIGFTTPITSLMRGHISVDFVVNKLSDRGKNLVNIVTRCVGIGLCLAISWYIMKIGTRFLTGGEVSGSLQLPLYPVAYGIAGCFFILSVVLFGDILKILGGKYE